MVSIVVIRAETFVVGRLRVGGLAGAAIQAGVAGAVRNHRLASGTLVPEISR